MIHELRQYRIRPGAMERYLHLIAEVGGPIRGDAYGRLLGFWLPVSGDGNEVVHLWEHESLDSRQRLRLELFALPAWSALVERIAPLVERQTIKLLSPLAPFLAPAGAGNGYELLSLGAVMGQARLMAELAEAELVRSAQARLVGLWESHAPDPNEIIGLLAHQDFDARRGSVFGAPLSQSFLASHAASLPGYCTRLMVPASHSPLQ